MDSEERRFKALDFLLDYSKGTLWWVKDRLWKEADSSFVVQALAAFVQSPSFAPAQDHAYAAAPLAEPVSADCPVAGFDGCVHVRYIPETRRLHLQVFGADGRNRCRPGFERRGEVIHVD